MRTYWSCCRTNGSLLHVAEHYDWLQEPSLLYGLFVRPFLHGGLCKYVDSPRIVSGHDAIINHVVCVRHCIEIGWSMVFLRHCARMHELRRHRVVSDVAVRPGFEYRY